MLGMNALMEAFPSGFSCLAIFSNQFGHQTNTRDAEIEPALKHLRPGNGFVAKFPMFARVHVNGAQEIPVFTYLKQALPIPTGAGGMHIMSSPTGIIWKPVKRSDVSWNFEKFLVSKEGIPLKRYSSKTPVLDIKKARLPLHLPEHTTYTPTLSIP
ncbi:hypothetical protein AAMO2058_001316200 [Amorphochlora amoebiformis]|uniref:Glutathione peroxidase n=1 Tax=Amorphochlora amoebiformis TaxID=1561963 RepID=A0A7S0DLC9_9EUKA|mmetsp:Transcript_29626/g.47320  ORF Transcript_29626/g.47320 Transcript_29626/m.47320 type:complete len:156 (+) Transcript_29626:214-681(+)